MADALPPNAPQPTPPSPQHLEGEQLEEAVVKQIDYYFSRQNLSTDAYLVSQMDSDMWVSISTIANFKKVHMLTSDVDFIVRVMSKSPNVVLDATRMLIKPSWKLQRNTLILRDIPSDAPEEEVKQIFSSRPVTNVHSDVGDTWFVTFASEDDALEAMLNISNVSFRGNPVKARVKAEHLLKSGGMVQPYNPYMMDPAAAYQAYRAYAGAQPFVPRNNTAPYAGVPQQPYWDGQGVVDGSKNGTDSRSGGRYRGGSGGGGGNRRGQIPLPQGIVGAQPAQGGVTTSSQPQHGGRPRGNSHGQGQAPFKNDVVGGGQGGKGRRKGKKVVETKQQVVPNGHPTPAVIVPQLDQQHFPSLLSPSGRSKSFKSGYTTDFLRYSKDDILRIITNVHDVTTRPATVIIAEPGVVEQKPNTDMEVSRALPIPGPTPVPESLELNAAPAPVPAPVPAPAPAPPPAPPPAPAPAPTPTPTPASAPSAPAIAAPGVAVREWPEKKQVTPAPASTPAAAASTTPAASAPALAPAPATPKDKSQAQEAPTSAPTSAATAHTPVQASAPASQPTPLRKSTEQNADSASSLSSSDGLKNPTYADIALGNARTNSPPIGNGKSPSLSTPSSSIPVSPSLASAAPPSPSSNTLEGKPQ